MEPDKLKFFALQSTRSHGEAIAKNLGIELSPHEERNFEDGEHKARSLVSVRGRDVFVVQSLYSDPEFSVNDKLIRLLFFLGSLCNAGAARVTVVVPYLGYARKDKRSQTRDPISTQYVARLFESVGIDGLVTLEVHNLAAFENAFRVTTDHLESQILFTDHFSESLKGRDRITVVSPDVGGTKRADQFRTRLEQRLQRAIGSGFMEKARAHGIMTPGRLVGDFADTTAIIFDDLISTGGTIAEAAKACRRAGAVEVYAAAAHGVFVGKAADVLNSADIDGIVVTDTIPPFRLSEDLVDRKVTVLETALLFAEAIRRIHTGESLIELGQI
jgi:ribose-phosphate pyrophosphokinase